MQLARQLGLAVIAIAAVAVWFVMAPAEPDQVTAFDPTSKTYATLIDLTLENYDMNNENTESAVQQQVVNGWVAKDLLTIMAQQNTDLLDAVGGLGDQNATASSLAVRDDRTPALLVLVVVAVAWFGITAPVARREDAPTPMPAEQPEAA
jgi:hypothetical protein